MRVAGLAGAVIIAAIAAGMLAFLLVDDTAAPTSSLVLTTPTPRPSEVPPTPLPSTWLSGVTAVHGDAQPILISCLDRSEDGVLGPADGIDPEVRVTLDETACTDPGLHADYYAGAPSDGLAYNCAASPSPLLIVAIASAGSDLLEPAEGESLGLIDIINGLQARVAERGISTSLIIAVSAIFGASQPQTGMERWIAAEVRSRLDGLPCLRAVLIGHSHGGATVTSVTAALDRYADRMVGVLIDRTIALYDRPATEMPVRTQLLNFFQVNEGWHGERIDAPNVANFDETAERAPVAPSDGGGGLAIVSHKTLDDSRGVQQRVIDAITAWLNG